MPACAGGGAKNSDGARRRWKGPGGMTGYCGRGGLFRAFGLLRSGGGARRRGVLGFRGGHPIGRAVRRCRRRGGL